MLRLEQLDGRTDGLICLTGGADGALARLLAAARLAAARLAAAEEALEQVVAPAAAEELGHLGGALRRGAADVDHRRAHRLAAVGPAGAGRRR